MPASQQQPAASRLVASRVWLLLASAALVGALAWWVRVLADPSALVAAGAAILTAAVAWREGRRFLVLPLVALAAGCWWIAQSDRAVRQTIEVDSTAGAASSADAARQMVSAIEHAQAALTVAAAAAATGTSAAESRNRLPPGGGIVVYDGERPVDWAGTTVAPTAALWERTGVITTQFDLVQYAVAVRGARRAVATMVVSAVPPANRLRPTLAGSVSEVAGAAFTIWPLAPGAETVDADATFLLGGVRIAIDARKPSVAARVAAQDEWARTRGSILLAAAAALALLAVWRRGTPLWQRLGALAIPATALVVTPLNTLSNVTRFFDASTYYAPVGGPFTASLGALAITSGLALFGVLAVLHSRRAPRQRGAAVVAVLLIALATPFLLRDLARGVTLPPQGAPTWLWLGWEVALFLAATSLLTAGVWAGQRALGRARGLPLWVAPLIGASAALLGPVLLGDFARWPDWYPFLWGAAVAALALARRSRAVLFPSAFVAACGATTLLWGVTLRERVELADADVAALGSVDAAASALLERFAADLARAPQPETAPLLISRYAAADLAVVDVPVALAHWPERGTPVLVPLGGQARIDEISAIVTRARLGTTHIVQPLRATPVSALALVVPHANGSASSVVVSARSQLNPALPFAELLGLGPPSSSPPYTLTVTGAAVPDDPDQTPWVRRGEHLHADWSLPAGSGERLRLHASVPFDAYDQLIPRGLLIVLFNVFIVALLWGVHMLADGALIRWLRLRRREWARSYRLRLGIALFAFFVVPALAFALWSYRRLQDDDRAARELLVREALRRATVADDGVTPIVRNVPPDIPLFVYRNGQLVSASDSLLLALAPTGVLLDPRVRNSLAAREELVATAPITIGTSDVLFGFRSLAPGLVAAVPARRDDASIDKRRNDLGVLLVLATVLGAFGALGLSGIAARQLARPIGTLRGGALAVAGGSRAPLNMPDAPSEFVPVFDAFDRMARDLAASEARLSRAERVFAWGEMARQVAHEIKNPLTPIRLGVQHLVRAWRDRRPDFGDILEENASRLLAEIDHLDSTARSFSQYGTSPAGPASVGPVDGAAVVRDVAAFESIAADGLDWRVIGATGPIWVRSRPAELREVLLNLCENSRLAGAHRVELQLDPDGDRTRFTVRDDGEGVPPEVLAKVFEPHFSTRTSGSGLGLAISRRLVEEWGGSIEMESAPGAGTAVHMRLLPAPPPSVPAAGE